VNHIGSTMQREEADFKKSVDLYLSNAGQLTEDSLSFIRECLTHAAHCQALQQAVSCFQGYNTAAMAEYLVCKFRSIL
jgi:hypothetical protein